MTGSGEVRQIVDSLRKESERALGKNLLGMYLFGSYARGDFAGNSDIDVLIVVNEPLSKDMKEEMSRIVSTLSLENDVVIACIIYEKHLFDHVQSPFILNVKEEGIKL